MVKDCRRISDPKERVEAMELAGLRSLGIPSRCQKAGKKHPCPLLILGALRYFIICQLCRSITTMLLHESIGACLSFLVAEFPRTMRLLFFSADRLAVLKQGSGQSGGCCCPSLALHRCGLQCRRQDRGSRSSRQAHQRLCTRAIWITTFGKGTKQHPCCKSSNLTLLQFL